MEDVIAQMSEVVLFEIPACTDVDRFFERIRPRWPGWTRREADVWLVAARVKADDNDLAVLLRKVEAYVAEAGLQAIRYCLDDRFYIVEAPALGASAAL